MAIDSEPSEPDMRTIRKTLRQGSPARGIVGWGGLALLALSALVLTSQTQSGNERLQQALSAVSSEPRAAVKIAEPAPAAVPEKSAETLRLEAQLQTLEADRDRLTARIATLERNLEDMTGSIRAQAERAAAAPPPASPAPAAAPPAIGAPQTSLPHISLPQVSAHQVTAPHVTAPQVSAPQVSAPPAGAPEPPPAPAPQAATPVVDPVPMPPVRVAVARPAVTETPPVRSSEYGIDHGGAPTGDALRARWASVKANFGPMLNGLHPVAVRDRRPGSTELRLVVGPLPNAAAARDLCARVAAAYANCRPGRYDGESFVAR